MQSRASVDQMGSLLEQERQVAPKAIVLSKTFSRARTEKMKINLFSQKRNPPKTKKTLLSTYLANNRKYKKRNLIMLTTVLSARISFINLTKITSKLIV